MKVKVKPEIHNHTLDEFDNQNLEPNKVYEVIGLSYDHYRVVNGIGDPILYPKYLFEVVDPSIPKSWKRDEYGPDEYYIDPPELSRPGFYEDYFDGKPEAKEIFRKFLASQEKMRAGLDVGHGAGSTDVTGRCQTENPAGGTGNCTPSTISQKTC